MIVSAYHILTNEIIERNHKPIVDALPKISNKESINWISNSTPVLWADQLSIYILTSLTLYYICCKSEPILFKDLEISIKKIVL